MPCTQDALQTMTGLAIQPTLISISNLNSTTEEYTHPPHLPYLESGAPGNISEANVTAAWLLGSNLPIPLRSSRDVQLHLQGAYYQTMSASSVPIEYQYGRFRPYLDAFPYTLPSFYPVNITFTLAGDM